jgi:Ca-activated chloride channel homolog
MMLLAGCSNNDDGASEAASEPKRDSEVEKYLAYTLPTEAEEYMNLPVGKYGTIKRDYKNGNKHLEGVADEIAALDVEGLSDEEKKNVYIAALFSLTKREFEKFDVDLNHKESDMPEITEEEKKYFKDKFNVEIVLDSSGSMAGKVDRQAKMDVAKKAITDFTSSLPKQANISLTVYGHKGSNEEKDKAASCSQIDTVYNNQTYNASKFSEALNAFQPTGWTPLAKALEKSMQNFANSPGDKNTNIIYVVSDGIETCDGNPVAVAEKMKASNIQPIVNIIGFDVDDAAQQQLKEIAAATNGKYIEASNADELNKEFKKSSNIAAKWNKWVGQNKTRSMIKEGGSYVKFAGIKMGWQGTQNTHSSNVHDTWELVVAKNGISKEMQTSVSRYFYDYFQTMGKTVYAYMQQKEAEIGKAAKEFNQKVEDKAKQNSGQ